MSEKRSPSAVLPHALPMPATTKLHGKRFVLASASPRRKAILETFVRARSTACASTHSPLQGLKPEVVVSDFAEDLPHGSFENLYEYPTATATEKAAAVYRKLVVRCAAVPMVAGLIARQETSPDDAPDLVIAGTRPPWTA